MRYLRDLLFCFLLLSGVLLCQTPEERLKTRLEQYKAAADKKVTLDAALACAGALRLAPTDKDAQACGAALRNPDQVNAVAKAGSAFLGEGELERALELCGAALVLNPLDKDAPECAKSARTRILTLAQDRSKLEQTRGYIAAGDSVHAATTISELEKSESADVVAEALQLQQKLNDQSAAQATAKQRAGLQQAELQIADGKRDAAALTVKDVLATTNDPAITREATQLLARSKTTWGTVFSESLRAAWIMQFLAALLMISTLWMSLHWMRDIWRWGDAHIARRLWRKSAKWTFAGVSEDTNLGSREPILDALRRVPNEVRMPVWTPTRLLLYPTNDSWEVWEDFAVDKGNKAKQIHEPNFQTFMQRENDDKLLADAFQNVQVSVGAVGLNGVTKFWSGLVDWWHAGEPSFSASARLIDAGNGTNKLVAVRISASGPDGMFSALAATKSDVECDAVALSAERAAYKLLFRMNDSTVQKRNVRKHGAFRRPEDAPGQAADTTQGAKSAHERVTSTELEVESAQQEAGDADKQTADAKPPTVEADKRADDLPQKPVEAQHQAVIAHTHAANAHLHAADAHEDAAHAHKPMASDIQETVEQIDAHAAFRQGATALAHYVRSVVDAPADRERRDEVLRDAIANLEFVQHTFNRDRDHHVYYVEALRFQAIGYVLLGREQAALVVLEALEDATAGPSNTPRDRQLELEAIYNQAMLHWKRAGDSIPSAAAEATMASFLWERLGDCEAELLHAERVWQLAQLANVPRANWPSVDSEKAQKVLDDSLRLALELQTRAKTASGAQRRYCLLLGQNLHRYYAIAQLRLIGTFTLPSRGPFGNDKPVSEDIAKLVNVSLACFAQSDAMGPASFNGVVTRAYGALLLSRFTDAEELARQAIEMDQKDQYARYIAAEAALQGKRMDSVRQYLEGLTRIEDTALRALADVLSLSPAAPQPAAPPV